MFGSDCSYGAQTRVKGGEGNEYVFEAGNMLVEWAGLIVATSHLICTRGHDPVAIFANSHTVAGFLKVKVLQQLDAVCKFGVVFETPTKTIRWFAPNSLS